MKIVKGVAGSRQEMTDQTKVEKLMVVSKMAGASGLLQLWTAIYPPLPLLDHPLYARLEQRI